MIIAFFLGAVWGIVIAFLVAIFYGHADEIERDAEHVKKYGQHAAYWNELSGVRLKLILLGGFALLYTAALIGFYILKG